MRKRCRSPTTPPWRGVAQRTCSRARVRRSALRGLALAALRACSGREHLARRDPAPARDARAVLHESTRRRAPAPLLALPGSERRSQPGTLSTVLRCKALLRLRPPAGRRRAGASFHAKRVPGENAACAARPRRAAQLQRSSPARSSREHARLSARRSPRRGSATALPRGRCLHRSVSSSVPTLLRSRLCRLLIAQRRPAEASLSSDEARSDAVVLRLAIACTLVARASAPPTLPRCAARNALATRTEAIVSIPRAGDVRASSRQGRRSAPSRWAAGEAPATRAARPSLFAEAARGESRRRVAIEEARRLTRDRPARRRIEALL